MAEHSSISQNLQPKYLRLARFVLENNYVECKGIEGSFLQRIDTAVGTSFSVTYATIFMIWLETRIIKEFQRQIVLYKRYIDDIFLIWSGSPTELCRFRERLGNANDNIKPVWQDTPLAEDAVNPARFDQYRHHQVNFLDLNITIVYSDGSADFAFKVYRRQTTSFIENSTEAGILLGGNGILHAMVVALSRAFRIQPSLTKVQWLLLTPLLLLIVPLL
jgi:hypothetical protein